MKLCGGEGKGEKKEKGKHKELGKGERKRGRE